VIGSLHLFFNVMRYSFTYSHSKHCRRLSFSVSIVALYFMRQHGATENASPVKCDTMKMTDQISALEFARPGKWRTKSHLWNLQDLENEGPNRRGWKMHVRFRFQFDFL